MKTRLKSAPASPLGSGTNLLAPHKTDSQEAFARLDLVITVVTIAVLLTLLVPSLADSGDQGGRTICWNNLRQLGQATLMYATDSNDRLPYPNWGNPPRVQGWLYTATNGMPPDPTVEPYKSNPDGAYATGQLFRYMRTRHNYLCPVDQRSPYLRQRSNKLSSYVMNGASCGYGTLLEGTTIKISDIWNLESYLLWEPDETLGSPPIGAFAFNDASTYPDGNEGLGRVHSTLGSHVVTVSGNATFVTREKFRAEQMSEGKSLTWWNTNSRNGR